MNESASPHKKIRCVPNAVVTVAYCVQFSSQRGKKSMMTNCSEGFFLFYFTTFPFSTNEHSCFFLRLIAARVCPKRERKIVNTHTHPLRKKNTLKFVLGTLVSGTRTRALKPSQEVRNVSFFCLLPLPPHRACVLFYMPQHRNAIMLLPPATSDRKPCPAAAVVHMWSSPRSSVKIVKESNQEN